MITYRFVRVTILLSIQQHSEPFSEQNAQNTKYRAQYDINTSEKNDFFSNKVSATNKKSIFLVSVNLHLFYRIIHQKHIFVNCGSERNSFFLYYTKKM